MSRSLTNHAFQSMMAPETDVPWIILMTFEHADLAEPIRVARNKSDITSNGNLYVGFGFDVSLPTDSADQAPVTQIQIDNVDQRITEALRTITSPATATLELILADDPDVVEITLSNLSLRRAEYDALVVTADLQYEDILHQAFPSNTYNPVNTPGIF